jgi:hypothetical protein
MRIRVLIVAALAAFAPTWNGTAFAQTRASGMSAFGSASGMSGFGSSGFGSSFGSSGFGASGFGNSSFGSGGFGSSGFGNSSFGSSRGGGQAFIGRDANDMQAIFTQFSRSSTQFFNNANRQMSRANRQQRAALTTRNPPQPIRTEVHVAFAAPRPSSEIVTRSLEVRLTKIMNDHHMTVPQVSVENGVAVLSGVAQSDNERLVIAQLVSMEPGVRSVRNEMTVAGEPNAGTTPRPGS